MLYWVALVRGSAGVRVQCRLCSVAVVWVPPSAAVPLQSHFLLSLLTVCSGVGFFPPALIWEHILVLFNVSSLVSLLPWQVSCISACVSPSASLCLCLLKNQIWINIILFGKSSSGFLNYKWEWRFKTTWVSVQTYITLTVYWNYPKPREFHILNHLKGYCGQVSQIGTGIRRRAWTASKQEC